MISEKEQKIVDAVNFYQGNASGINVTHILVIISNGKFFRSSGTDYIGDKEVICTIEEFNQCVKEMSHVAGVDAFIENQCKKMPAKPFLQSGEAFEHTKTLNFIRERMINIHGENSNYDYMHELTNAIIFMESVEDQQKETKMSEEKPRMKAEYVKVDKNGENGKYWECAKELAESESDLQYANSGVYFKINDNDKLLFEYKNCNVYRKVKTEITWQDEAVELIDGLIIADGLVGMTPVSESDFIAMCHLVSSMNK